MKTQDTQEKNPLNESPDYVDAKWLNWSDSDAFPFIIDNNITRLWMGKEPGGQHVDIMAKDNGEDVASVHTRKNSWQGRLWRREKVMSFWRTPKPDQAAKIVELFNKYDNTVDYGEYYLEKADEELVKFKDYINGSEKKQDIEKFKATCERMGIDINELFHEIEELGKFYGKDSQEDAGQFDLSKLHTMDGALKSMAPQMKAYLQARIDRIGRMLGKPNNSREVTPAEYNHYRRYGMGECVVVKENPDVVKNNVENIVLPFNSDEACAFVVTDDYSRAWFGGLGETHKDVLYDLDDPETKEADEYGLSAHVEDDYTRYNSYHGRIWVKSKVISFWDVLGDGDLGQTVDVGKAVKTLMSCPSYEPNAIGNLEDYRIDLGEDSPMPTVRQYLNGEFDPDNNNNQETFDKTTQHIDTNSDKRQNPDMDGYLRNREERQSERLGNMSKAEYNHLRRYGMGEAVERMDEVKDSDISLSSFKTKDELHPKFWVNGKLNSRVRLRLLDIADDFFKEMAVDWVKPSDIVITGSIANYNWSKYSDIDVHILVDFSKVWNKRKDFVEDYFKSKKEQWSAAHPKLTIYGFPVEIYVEDTDSNNPSTGIYSLEKNKWIKDPVDFQDAKLNEKYIKSKAASFMTEIDRICKAIAQTKDNHRYEKLGKEMYDIFSKLKKLRAEGLKNKGEMSSGNIIWKVCRRTGYIEKMWDVVNKAYDRINSIREDRLSNGGDLIVEGFFNTDATGWVNIGIVRDYCPLMSGTDSYLMVDPNAEEIEDKSRFRSMHMTYCSKPEGTSNTFWVPNYYEQKLEIYPEYQDTYWGECVLGKKKSKEDNERDWFEFGMRLNRDGQEVILQHYSPTEIKGSFITGGHPKRGYSNNADIGTYFWGSPMAGSDPSNRNRYIYYCRVPLADIYDFQHNPERLTLTQALEKHKYAGQYWRNSKAVCVNTFCKTPIWFIRDTSNNKCYDANWRQIRDPFA